MATRREGKVGGRSSGDGGDEYCDTGDESTDRQPGGDGVFHGGADSGAAAVERWPGNEEEVSVVDHGVCWCVESGTVSGLDTGCALYGNASFGSSLRLGFGSKLLPCVPFHAAPSRWVYGRGWGWSISFLNIL